MKLLPIAAVVLAGALFAAPAEARCWWNGHGWQCSNAGQHAVPHHPVHRLPAPWLGY